MVSKPDLVGVLGFESSHIFTIYSSFVVLNVHEELYLVCLTLHLWVWSCTYPYNKENHPSILKGSTSNSIDFIVDVNLSINSLIEVSKYPLLFLVITMGIASIEEQLAKMVLASITKLTKTIEDKDLNISLMNKYEAQT